MDTESIEQAVRASSWTRDFPPAVVDRLVALAHWRNIAPSTVLFREGDHQEAFFLVHRGQVALEMCIAGRGCTRLLTLGPGDVVAWSSLVGDGRMTATALAQGEVVLIQWPGPELLALCESDPEFGYRLMRRLASALSQRLLATRLQLLDLFTSEPTAAGGVDR